MTVLSPSECLSCDTRCAVRCSGDGEPLTRLGILDRVTFLDLGQRHLFCYMFRTHYRPPGSSRRSAITLRILPPPAPFNQRFTPLAANFPICDLATFVVAWSLADLAGHVQPGIEEVKTAMGFRQMVADR